MGKVSKKLMACALASVMAVCLAGPAAAFADDDPTSTPQLNQPGVQPVNASDGETAPGTGTELQLQYEDTGNRATNSGSEAAKANFKVQVPVAIQYVVDKEGAIRGPSDAQAKITNYSSYSVRVKDLVVTDANHVTITSGAPSAVDEVYLSLTPKNKATDGTAISLGSYKNTVAETTRQNQLKATEDWNMAPVDTTDKDAINTVDGVNNVLELNSLTGSAKGFQKINLDSMTKIGSIEWTIVPGWNYVQSLHG